LLKRVGGAEISYRADIDGLRAVAVLSVLVFHAYPKLLPGGFIGVDVFFVISGFLISKLIAARLNKDDFNLIEFYERRIRRIFPALIVVLLATLALGWLVLLPTEFLSLGEHTLWGSAFSANILSFLQSGYFDAPASRKPLLHLWSLGVEEQFYFVFPALLILLWRGQAVTRFLALIGIASFALNVGVVGKYPSFTFFLPLTRFWEFLVGAFLAWGDLQPSKAARSVITALSAPQWCNSSATAGALLIVGGLTFATQTSFPGWRALLPVVGAFLLMGAGEEAWFNRHVLAHPVFVFVGLISYPLYLWHWPLLVIGRITMEGYGNRYEATTAPAAIVLAFVLSWLTFEFIERPIRARRSAFAAHKATAALVAGMATAALLGLITVELNGLPTRYPKEVQALIDPSNTATTVYVDPDDVIYQNKKFGGPVLVAYGDSHALHLRAGLRQLQNQRPFQMQLKTWALECVPMVAEVNRADEETCRRSIAAEHQYFEQLRPDIVVIAGFWLRYKQIDRLAELLQFFQQIGIPRIVVIGSVPLWRNPPAMLLYRAYKADPLHKVPERLSGFDKETTDIDRQLGNITSKFGVRLVLPFDTLCNSDGCLARLGYTARDIIQFDQTHLTTVGSRYFLSRVAYQIFD
jgi:peptidoglycan/LPS O-acetylase OafA/YrhL